MLCIKSSETNFIFPMTNGRRYSPKWEEKFPWLRYSNEKEAAFCVYCLAFGSESHRSSDLFVDKGFRDWKNATGTKRGILNSHNESKFHQEAAHKSLNYKQIVMKGDSDIYHSISKSYEEKVKRNREILIRIIDTIVVLGQQNIPFRGHHWDKESKTEDGNFGRLLRWKSEEVPVLKNHLETAAYNSKYTSPDIQNEFINLAGYQVRDTIIRRIKDAKWFSVMADECTDAGTKEQMSVCFRFVDKKGEVYEDFVGFVELDKVDADSISAALMKIIGDCGLDISNLRGQGYDGASVMSGQTSGVRKRIQEHQPRAIYHHCRAHVLNLVVASSCKSITEIRNLFDSISQLTWYLGGSAKRKAIVERYIFDDDTDTLVVPDDSGARTTSEALIDKAAKKKQVPKLCETRWTARVDTLSAVIANYKCIIQSLEDICTESSDSESRLKASSHIRMLKSSQFIVALVIAHHILSFTRPLSQSLQRTDCDIVKAFDDARVCQDVVKEQRSDDIYEGLWRKINTLATSVDTQIEKPRTSNRMVHRSTAGEVDDSASRYYKLNVFFPFIDHCLAQLDERFSEDKSGMYLASQLMPHKVEGLSEADMAKIFEWHCSDLPEPESF